MYNMEPVSLLPWLALVVAAADVIVEVARLVRDIRQENEKPKDEERVEQDG
jgi:hypothetical protein